MGWAMSSRVSLAVHQFGEWLVECHVFGLVRPPRVVVPGGLPYLPRLFVVEACRVRLTHAMTHLRHELVVLCLGRGVPREDPVDAFDERLDHVGGSCPPWS